MFSVQSACSPTAILGQHMSLFRRRPWLQSWRSGNSERSNGSAGHCRYRAITEAGSAKRNSPHNHTLSFQPNVRSLNPSNRVGSRRSITRQRQRIRSRLPATIDATPACDTRDPLVVGSIPTRGSRNAVHYSRRKDRRRTSEPGRGNRSGCGERRGICARSDCGFAIHDR
ncbi:Uncharacterised protein [Agrobacterium tumefaciens]|nr:Uncharacterised protein [Agrobacterium tumefaciens]